MPGVQTFEVKSLEPDFELRAARVLEGPFTATVKKAKGGYQVTVTADPPAHQTKVVAGKLVLVSNDPLEPSKEIRITLGRPRPGLHPRPASSR